MSQSQQENKTVRHRLVSKAKGFIGRLWPRVRPVVGMPLIYIFLLFSVVFYFTDLTDANPLLFLPLLLITVGIIGSVALK